MTNLIQSGIDWAAEQLMAHASDEVAYSRGASSLSGLAAVIGTSDHEDSGSHDILVMVQSQDFVILAASLILASAVTEPADKDQIVWEGRTYEVRPFGIEKRSWVFEDAHQTMIRIHTKQIA